MFGGLAFFCFMSINGGNMSRHDIRKKAFELLFAQQINDYIPEELVAINEDFEEQEIDAGVKELFLNTLLHKEEFDGIIESLSKKRSIARMPKSVVSILRLALYEIKYDEKVPTSVAISEAVLLAKDYCDEGDVSFINGLLGNFARNMDE